MVGALSTLHAAFDELRAELAAGTLLADQVAAARSKLAAFAPLLLASSSASPHENDGAITLAHAMVGALGTLRTALDELRAELAAGSLSA
eukprot:CAMPEP_0119413258 /NCGR_PEP_ID=MMETSP1335-20130426/5410_1 /TAXON_ID=259385 /ORGANISM="Chrysoculter rhomboideus, Strain RCC1486" /LENGTH=89 /DNA_ID=CAMNT_0007438041 /DNA_START=18 /DNA_END=284 /DNA_ORIENTATION=-